jgi:hypothetical protein
MTDPPTASAAAAAWLGMSSGSPASRSTGGHATLGAEGLDLAAGGFCH